MERILSDESWKCATGALRSSDIFNGETFDATKDLPGWDSPGYDDSDWHGVLTAAFDRSILAAQRSEPVKEIEEIKPIAVLKTPKGEMVIDFGQNMAGWVRLKARGSRGTEITVQHGEVLDQQGNFFNENLRMAKAADRYILAGTGEEEVLEPRFTFHGFRYAKVEGYPGVLTAEKAIGVVIHTDLERTGDFRCSNDLVNRLFQNIVWSQRGNFLDLPTDCPQRDERMGWGADIQIFTPTACLNMNSAPFLCRWLRDLRLDQRKIGAVPGAVPDPYFNRLKTLGRVISHMAFRRKGDEKDFFDEFFALFVIYYCPAWGDAAIIIPWHLYQAYGDRRVLEEQYESMRSLFRFHIKKSGGISSLLLMNPVKWFRLKTWKLLKYYYTAIGFGDWLAPGDGMDKSIFKSMFYIPTVYLALDALILSKTAAVLGKLDDAAYYESMYEKIRSAYQHFKIRKDGKLRPHRQTAYVLALGAGLIPGEDRADAARILADMVRQNDYQLGTGIHGTSHICRVLCEHGYADHAYRLLLNEDHQWLYQVKKGATTLWEHWDAIRPDGSYQPARMLSFNHYAYGAIGAWLFQDVAGINLDEADPGYRTVIIRPVPGGGMSWARAEYESIHGMIKSGWKTDGDKLLISATIPPNTRGVLIVPAGHAAVSLNGNAVTAEGRTIEVGSGNHELICGRER
jgi:alpha-L-rhamnosidase